MGADAGLPSTGKNSTLCRVPEVPVGSANIVFLTKRFMRACTCEGEEPLNSGTRRSRQVTASDRTVLLYPVSGGKALVYDATCKDTFLAINLMDSIIQPGPAAKKTEPLKNAKFHSFSDRYLFAPLPFEPTGVLGPGTLRMVVSVA